MGNSVNKLVDYYNKDVIKDTIIKLQTQQFNDDDIKQALDNIDYAAKNQYIFLTDDVKYSLYVFLYESAETKESKDKISFLLYHFKTYMQHNYNIHYNAIESYLADIVNKQRVILLNKTPENII